MSTPGLSEEQSLHRVQQQNQNGMSNDGRLGGAATSSNAQISSPSKGNIDLPFGPGNDILGQPSSPPHNYRHSRAYRHFKNPPQPHMCIRVTTLSGEEVFINVLSWTRIVVPQEPTDPIPLYGGMKVAPGSPRCPPLVYAVMANPEVLKDSGRHSKDPEERRAMVELMCDFVEAMNPDLRLNRNAVILKDRDISGELKDVWNAVQAQRDREREEQMMQQHAYVPPPQQLFPPQKIDTLQLGGAQNSSQNNFNASDNKVIYMELGPEIASVQDNTSRASVNSSEQQNSAEKGNPSASVVQSAIISNNANNVKNSLNEVSNKSDVNSTEASKNESDQIDSPRILKNGAKDTQTNNSTTNTNRHSKTRSNTSPVNESQNITTCLSNSEASSSGSTSEGSQTATSPVSPTTASSSLQSVSNVASTSNTVPSTAATTKKEKLGGFLPNSCIFPRFKNKNKEKNKEKEKDKDKDKDKEKNSSNHSSKEKTLLNSFKKTTTAATNAFTKSHTHNEDSTATAMKNCLNLEAEVEKLDLNKLDAPHANEVLIKVATPAAK